jgi:hypothetical protein
VKLRIFVYGVLGLFFLGLGYYFGLKGPFYHPMKRSSTLVLWVDANFQLPSRLTEQFKIKTGAELLVRYLDSEKTEDLDSSAEAPDFLILPLSRQEAISFVRGEIVSQKGLAHLERDLASDFKIPSWGQYFPIFWTLPCPKLENSEAINHSDISSFDYPFSEKSVLYPSPEIQKLVFKELSQANIRLRWLSCAAFLDPIMGKLTQPKGLTKTLSQADFIKLTELIKNTKRELVLFALSWVPKKQKTSREIISGLIFFTRFQNLNSIAVMNSFGLTLNSSEERVERRFRPSALKSWSLQQIFSPHKARFVGSK